MLFIPPLPSSQSSLPFPGVCLPPEKKLLEALHPPPLFFFLLLSSLASHYLLPCSSLSKYGTSDHQHGQPSWLAASTNSSHVSGRGPPICLGCCQLLVMRRHPPNVIKSLKKNLKVPGSWKGVYNNIIISLYIGSTKNERNRWNHNEIPKKTKNKKQKAKSKRGYETHV